MAVKLCLVSLGLLVAITSLVGIVNCQNAHREPIPKPYYPDLCDVSGESSEECSTTIEEPMYLLYTDPHNPDNFTQIYLNDNDTVRITRANPHNGGVWKILIHGFLNNGKSRFPVNVKNAYLQRTLNTGVKYNVLVVDWGKAACASLTSTGHYLYDYAAKNVAQVGRRLGEFIVFLHDNEFMDMTTDAHIIGFSLGAHVAGNAGYRAWYRTGKVVRRITGLDPAGPAFWAWDFVPDFMLPEKRLHRHDTLFTDIYHTSKSFGSEKKMGDVDFIINGGESQPSCVPKPFNYFVRDFIQVCSHNYVTDLFAKSINDSSMHGCMCPSYLTFKLGNCRCQDQAVFGEFTDK
ncbi:Inactive pancreatic lipase-related protein 1 [Orchesella cincta]|uniref:Inactive pancreatic lipase-related protein 1 n=1 Tax=Orchesella cincta TaxID=48709 RepID=A0A1D2MQD7_ORCCI|nr:Inactive pancreatic lipase-related protein 1 [Orchesella cincta]